jgi:hypothetical protein
MFYLRVRQVAVRVGRPGLAGQALMVAALSPSLAMSVVLGSNQGLFTVTPAAGWAGVVAYVVRMASRADELLDLLRFVSWPILFTICQLAVLIQLLVALRRVPRSAAAAAAAAARND